MADLFILAADKNMQFALAGAIPRYQSLGIRQITFDSDVHVGRDGGARTSGVEILELQRSAHSHALLVLDFEGCGSHLPVATDVEQELDRKLMEKFDGRAKAIVIEPECDIWIWGSDNSLAEAIGWESQIGIRDWLLGKGFEFDMANKPLRPKEAIEAVLRVNKTDVPPILSSTPIWSPIPRSKEIGREEAIYRRADHWLSA